MIPKTIHYCWFGGNPKPEIVEKCIASWRQYCPDWEIIEWNEANYDVAAYDYTKEAYGAKKWAFVSDMARLEILYQHGGVYLDADVELLEAYPFDVYLNYETVLAFETERAIASGLFFASVPGAPFLQKLLQPYRETTYSRQTETVNSMMNKPVLVEAFPELKWNAQSQTIRGAHFVGIGEYHQRMRHHGTRSWCDDLPDYTVKHHPRLNKILRNPAIFEFLESNRFLEKLVPVYTFLVYDLMDLGPAYYIKRFLLKLRKR